jgi:hypothetical protein
MLAIGASQLVLAAVLGWLYFEHVRTLHRFRTGRNMDYLEHFFYAKGRESPFAFTWRSLSGTFSYAVGTRLILLFFALACLAGFAALLAGRTKARRSMAILLIAPFAAGFAFALLQVFPFAGSRHQTYLLPFLAAAVSASLAWLRRRQALALMLLAAIIAPRWVMRTAPDNNPRVLPMADMTRAIGYLGRTVPPGTPLFVDSETRETLRYYLTRYDLKLDTFRLTNPVEEQLGNYRVVVPPMHVWEFESGEALEEIAQAAQAVGVPPADPLWIVSASWLDPPLASRLPAVGSRAVKVFGRISFIETSGTESSPITVY